MGKKNSMSRDDWDGLAADFSERVLEISELDIDGVIVAIAQHLGGKTKTAIDFGCGAGAVTRAIAPYFKSVLGVDFSAKLIDEARGHTKALNIDFETGDLTTMRGKKYTCDVAFCANVLIHPDEKIREKIAKRVVKNVRPGGQAAFIVPSLESVIRAHQVTLQCQVGDGIPPGRAAASIDKDAAAEIVSLSRGVINIGATPTKHFLEDEFREFLTQCCLKDVSLRRIPYPWAEVLENIPSNFGAAPPWDWLAIGKA